jgi:hypothetical protein
VGSGQRWLALRRLALEVAVLDAVDVEPRDDGLVLPGLTPVEVSWPELQAALADLEPDAAGARHRISGFLRLRRAVADHGAAAAGWLRATARLVALPAGHLDHLGPDWVRQHQLGGALDLGTGVLDPDDRPGVVLPLPPGIAAAAGVEPQEWWPHLFAHAERMGRLAMTRLSRDAASVLRPVGGCDVLALLSSPSLRGHLATGDGSGMRSVAVPIRSRGWFDLRRVDPAFVAAAWTATPEPDRGVPRALLVTADEVALARDGGGVGSALDDG